MATNDEDLERRISDVDEKADYATATATEALDLGNKLDVLGEALTLIRGMLDDIVRLSDHLPDDEFAADLDRLDQLAHLAT